MAHLACIAMMHAVHHITTGHDAGEQIGNEAERPPLIPP
jgi:hypothetical protein